MLNNKARVVILGIIAAGLVLVAVFFYPVNVDKNNATSEVTDFASLVASLNALGATVEPSGMVSQPYFSTEGKTASVNGETIQVFEYPDAESASREAALISPDGSSIGTTMVLWVDSPHFYKWDKLIVLYLGDDQITLGLLQALIGDQIAGR
ncbi:MAG: hypothetical protein V3U25_02405 [Nitrososphaerales archaeon]